jgi:GT2 family glycosyltransferase
MEPKILVGCPTSDHKAYCLKEYAEGLKRLTYKSHDVLIVDNSKSNAYSKKIRSLGLNVIKDKYAENARDRIISSRNIIREEAIKKYDYLLSLEQDVIPPPDIIERLLKHKKEIITGVYFTYKIENGEKTITPLLWTSEGGELRNLTEDEAMEGKVKDVEAAGLGCILISKEALKKIKFRYDKRSASFDDMWFSKDAKDMGHKIFADTGIICKHLIERWGWNGIKK